jgi:hypothetical protein
VPDTASVDAERARDALAYLLWGGVAYEKRLFRLP